VKQFIGLTALLVRNYDDALDYYVGLLGFRLLEDTYVTAQDKRWVVIERVGPALGAGRKSGTSGANRQSNRGPGLSFLAHR
jgi:catechol 2,3-dioxygenase-like lactoylglutathione lyase family enzyme